MGEETGRLVYTTHRTRQKESDPLCSIVASRLWQTCAGVTSCQDLQVFLAALRASGRLAAATRSTGGQSKPPKRDFWLAVRLRL